MLTPYRQTKTLICYGWMKEDADIKDCGLNPVAVMISWYFVPFLFVLIHEEALNTRFTSHLPDSLGWVFEIIYAPLLLPF